VASRSYRWYVGVQVVSMLGTMMGYTALYWLALRISHGSAAALSAVAAAQSLPMLVLSRRAGTILSRHRAVRVYTVTQALQVAGSLAIGIPLLAGRISLAYLVPVAFAIGCVQTVDVPARQTFMLDLTGPAELRRGASLYATITGLGKIAGPAVAGFVIAASGETSVFFVDAVSFAGVIAVLLGLSATAGRGETPPDATATAARRFRWLLDLPRGARTVALMALLLGGFGLQFGVTGPLMATGVFRLGPAGFGLFGTCMAVGGIAGNYGSSRRGDPGPAEFLGWALVFGAAETAAAVMPVAWAYDLVLVILGAATQLFAVSATVYLQQATPAVQRGHALAAYNAGFMGFIPAGAFAVAGIAAIAGVRWALIIPGLVVAACAAVLLAGQRKSVGTAGAVTAQSPDEHPHSVPVHRHR
jgi:MFS family permease